MKFPELHIAIRDLEISILRMENLLSEADSSMEKTINKNFYFSSSVHDAKKNNERMLKALKREIFRMEEKYSN